MFKITERIAQEELSLPIGPTITIEEAEVVAKAVNSFMQYTITKKDSNTIKNHYTYGKRYVSKQNI